MASLSPLESLEEKNHMLQKPLEFMQHSISVSCSDVDFPPACAVSFGQTGIGIASDLIFGG